ncbi:MAG TPA: hypothetical protein VN661_02645 [Candidatus Acidoferrales bacterium]|nr:hypothetical protein [Candidatus Acidoferrales bacterium]
MKWAIPFLIALALCLSVSARPDELKLKDGTKISGTIVGYEENSFKVKTTYGFAVVQKSQVVSISIKSAAPEPAKKAESAKPVASKQPPEKSEKSETTPPEKPVAAPAKKPEAIGGSPTKAALEASPAKQAAVSPAPTAEPAAVAEPAPVAIREEVSGNSYANLTYGFQMYKPPDWQVIAGARSILPGAITAMGTEDHTTYLLIGRQAVGKSVAADISSTEQRLSEIVDHFRPLAESRIAISGLPAVERRFRGSVNGQDWSGIVVYLPRDGKLYTIFGMTLAATDLVQIQENVIARAISSLRFVP